MVPRGSCGKVRKRAQKSDHNPLENPRHFPRGAFPAKGGEPSEPSGRSRCPVSLIGCRNARACAAGHDGWRTVAMTVYGPWLWRFANGWLQRLAVAVCVRSAVAVGGGLAVAVAVGGRSAMAVGDGRSHRLANGQPLRRAGDRRRLPQTSLWIRPSGRWRRWKSRQVASVPVGETDWLS